MHKEPVKKRPTPVMSKFNWIKLESRDRDNNNKSRGKNDAFQKILLSRVPMDASR